MVFQYFIRELILTTTNTSMTVYHKVYDKATRLDKWERYPIENVMWQGGKGASIDRGYEKANDINIWISYANNEGLEKIPFSIGDIVVKGNINTVITKQSDLEVDNFNITTLINNNYGSDLMRHIQIGAK